MKLYLGGYFSFFFPGKPQWLEIELPEPQSLREVLEQNGVPLGEVALVVVNKDLVELDQVVVTNQDEVRLYPPMDGG
jgi:sulfur carrier protein ThiS